MATFLDLGLLEFFLPIFYSMLIFAGIFAILTKIGIFGENKTMVWIFTLGITFVIMFSGSPLELINFVTPWYGFLALFLFFMFMVLGFAGLNQGGSREEDSVLHQMGGGTTIFVIAMIILFVGISKVFSGALFPYNEGGTDSVTLRTIFHPRVLGAFLILVIISFVIRQIDMEAAHSNGGGKK